MKSAGKVAGLAFAAGVGVAAVAAVSFARAALDAEKSQTRLDAAFRHANTSAKERATAMKAVNAISVKSGLDDEDLADSLAKLTQVTGDATKATSGMATAADIARAKGIDLEAATGIVTKAALGNVGALKRQGIEIPKVTTAQDALKESHTKATAEQVKAAKAADDLATRQGALAALQKKFGGDAEEYGKTASGAMDRFKVAIENVQEGLGAALLPALASVAGGVADFLEKFNQAEGAGEKFRVVMDGIKTVASQAWDALKAAFNAIDWGAVWDTVSSKAVAGVSKLGSAVMAAIRSVDWKAAVADAGSLAGEGIVTALDKLGSFISKVNWNAVGQEMIKGLGKAIGAVAVFLANVDWGAVIGKMINLLVAVIRAQVGVLLGIATTLGGAIMRGLASGLDVGWDKVWNFIKQIPGTITNLFASAGSWLYNAGLSVLTGLWNGLKAKWDAVAGWLGSLKDKIIGLKGPPSADATLLTENGKLIIQSLQTGMQSAWEPAAAWLASLGDLANSKLSEGVKATASKVKDALAESVNAALDNAEKLVSSRKSTFEAAFSTLASAAGSAFDTIMGDVQTPAEKQLAAIERKNKEAALLQAEADAGVLLAQAQTAEEKLAAEQAYAAAEQAIQVYNLEQQAATERTQRDAIVAITKEKMEAKLAAIQTALENEKITQEQAHTKIMAVLQKFIPDYETKGKLLGQAMVDGIESKINAAAKAAEKLARAFAVNIKVTASAAKVDVAGARALGGPVLAGKGYVVGENGPEFFVPKTNGMIVPNGGGMTAAAGGGIVVNVSTGNVYGTGGIQELARQLEVVVQRATSRNG